VDGSIPVSPTIMQKKGPQALRLGTLFIGFFVSLLTSTAAASVSQPDSRQ